jgi:hypothetical protein
MPTLNHISNAGGHNSGRGNRKKRPGSGRRSGPAESATDGQLDNQEHEADVTGRGKRARKQMIQKHIGYDDPADARPRKKGSGKKAKGPTTTAA